MDAIADWFWFGGGGGLAIIALALLYWSLLHDRPRGRRRCPKCWYDMSGSPPPGMTCSECGFVAKREKKLFKTRRRWRWATLALVVGLMGTTSLMTPRVYREGWNAAPTLVLLFVYRFPSLPIHADVFDVIDQRVRDDELRRIEWRILHWMNARDVQFAADFVIRIPERWLAADPVNYEVGYRGSGRPLPGVGRRTMWDSGSVHLVVQPLVEGAELFEGGLVWHPRFGPEVRPSRKGRSLGRVAPGEHDLVFAIGLSQPSKRDPAVFHAIWSGVAPASMTVYGSPNDVLEAVNDDDRVSRFLSSVSLARPTYRPRNEQPHSDRMAPKTLRPAGKDNPIVGGRMSVFRNEEMVWELDVLWESRNLIVVEMHIERDNLAALALLDPANATWRASFTSDARLIFYYAPNATHYWDGTIGFPLQWDASRGRFVPGQ